MKYIIISSTILAVVFAQRPSYASSGPIGRPGLGSRFKENNTGSSSTSDPSFENRVGETNSSTTTVRIPVDAKGDVDLVNTLNSWDREHQPFWFINAEHIERQRNTTRNPTTAENVQIPNRNQLDSQTMRYPSTVGKENYPANENRFSFTDIKPQPHPVPENNQQRDWLYGRPPIRGASYGHPEGVHRHQQQQFGVDPYRQNRQNGQFV